MIYREPGQATFAHECDLRRHAVTVSWGAAYPALDLNSLPACACGGDYERIEVCPEGDHECHPIAGHVERSDDHTAGLVGDPEKDPEEEELAHLKLLQWTLQQRHLISQLEQLLEAGGLTELESTASRITLIEARRALRATGQGAPE